MTDAQTPDVRAAAREYDEAGLCVLPIKADGSKAASVKWTPYKVTRSTSAEHDRWFPAGTTAGIAVVYGSVSGGVELIEFEGTAIEEELLDEVTEVMEASGLGEEWHAILTGWASTSPSGGRHFRVRVDGGPVRPNTKLASRLARPEEYTPEEKQRLAEKPGSQIIRVQIETRGEGGYGLVEPSGGTVHATGRPYLRTSGAPATIPTISAERMDAIHEICRMVDTLPKAESPKAIGKALPPLPDGGLRPGDDFERRADWETILNGIFVPVTTRGSTTYWGWADGKGGVKATTGRGDADRLYVFTTSSELTAETPYSKFGAYAQLHHGGNHKAAAAALREQGYGSAPVRRRLSSVPAQQQHFADGSSALDPDHAPDPQEGFEGGPQLRAVQARPDLDITNEADGIDGVLALMKDGRLPDLYRRSGGPCWVYRDDNDDPVVQQLASDNLRAYLADHVSSYVVKRNPVTEQMEEHRELLMPKSCATVLGRKDWPLPTLRGVVTSPVIRPDGSLLESPGYDRPTGLYLEPRVPLRRLQPQVTKDSLERAKSIVLGDVLHDFPWVKPSDRANFLGALLTPILRAYFHGPTQMVAITATAAGSGKTLLKDIFKYCFGTADTAWPENDTELRKSITTQLYGTGSPVVVFDNLPNGFVLKTPILSALLTGEHWGDRILGATGKVTMRNDRLWVVTGNALRTGGDNKRRILWVRLDPDCPDPDQRDGFRIGDLRPWLRTNASTLVAALVTLVRAWLAAGAPVIRVRKGDYSEWASMMAGLLHYLGVEGWMADTADAENQDDEQQEWSLFLEMWRETYGAEPLATGAVIKGLPNHVPRKGDEPPSANQLGIWLKARQGRYFGVHKVVMVVDSHRKQNLWRVDVHADRGTGRHER
ncbi:bifunctional DNA primase/polymerase [Streptomyces sp. MBT56]|uniref:bifunctional DNA primase/polymerase n=1 Tax=unclassified Streptomyces TaxID=2593676 RepID=UPI00190997D9|nr:MULTISPECIES: bifunctional DNA primase/polymerase [unclassified Streptomyces]MBK3555677.1 bifunctional DNA primase/polymerase [Streptomyces sp. MBT56]MBK3602406.1 bifunctional DNA primase/polymerase [Streptomyces sp. MBT54]MBK3617289.1 bifunctional DNA primase/polymerase [Streptomyces sp. MBT98]